ncbi:Regulatory protein CAT8 [Colletotrichum orbiculare MAFF 240422]|uniref:Regulatory protein CAT8 n=1 Tax=Colletotrichum orbiculare (strain 104-T / ATCC 96160 / CBS 514.97 / LARS 414 / MAFF 240422) TaxID=1213857 RepID=A0A484F9R7_COLOR|nr:Regulatory protein CAT8 [Colletotrichum orbiculare MAFF 240422]
MDPKGEDDPGESSSKAAQAPGTTPSAAYRPLRPAPVAGSAAAGPQISSVPERPLRPPRQPVPAACLQCRRRKVKCTGTRPTCFRCANQGLDCHWDTEPDTTRVESLRRRNEELERENDDLH